MSETQDGTAAGDLQFDRVVPESGAPAASDAVSVTCTGCRRPIQTEYFDVNGKTFCRRCRDLVDAHADTPRGMTPFMIAGLFGLGAGLAGAVVYYAVMAILNLE